MIAILGGGLSGLQLGRRLRERGQDFVIIEKNDGPGGLCRTLRRGEYSWDLGPHGFYSKRADAMEYYRALPLQYRRIERKVRVCHRHRSAMREVGYPFENGLADLPLLHRLECVAGYCWASWRHGGGPFRNLRHWIEEGLGRGIARHFMLPYNEKIWSCPLDRISMDLVAQKIEPERPWTIVRNSLRAGTVGRAYQARFLYPTEGGAGAVPTAVAANIRGNLRTGVTVRRLRRAEGRWRISGCDGSETEAATVVSTLPIPELLDALGEPELLALRPHFAFNDTLFVVVGLKRGCGPVRFGGCQWVFFAGPEIFYRVSMMENFSQERPPTIVAEMTHNGPGPSLAPREAVSRVLRDLVDCGIIPDDSAVAMAEAHLERFTYPIQTVGLPEALRSLEDRLTPMRVLLLGRMGRWEYINSDGVFLRVDEFLARHSAFLADAAH